MEIIKMISLHIDDIVNIGASDLKFLSDIIDMASTGERDTDVDLLVTQHGLVDNDDTEDASEITDCEAKKIFGVNAVEEVIKDVSAEDNSEDFDSDGVKYDPQLHSKTRSKNKDGTWRLQRGINIAVTKNQKPEIQKKSQKEIDTVPPTQQYTYANIIKLISENINKKIITHADVHKILADFNIQKLTQLNQSPDVFNDVYAAIEQLIIENSVGG
jgi:hypothetical protein